MKKLLYLITLLMLCSCSKDTEVADTLPLDASLALESAEALPKDCDYLIISAADLKESALQLATYRLQKTDDVIESPRVLTTTAINATYAELSSEEQIQLLHKTMLSLLKKSSSLDYIVLWGHTKVNGLTIGGIPEPDSREKSDQFFIKESKQGPILVRLGRVPVTNEIEAEHYIRKLIAFEAAPAIENHLYTTDDKWSGNKEEQLPFYEMACENLEALQNSTDYTLTPTLFNPETFNSDENTPLSKEDKNRAVEALLSEVNSANNFISYDGHGSPTTMMGDSIFFTSHCEKITTTNIYATLACNINRFAEENSIARKLITQKESGAALIIGNCDASYFSAGLWVQKDFFKELFGSAETVGEAYFNTMQRHGNSSRLIILGDPAISLQ